MDTHFVSQDPDGVIRYQQRPLLRFMSHRQQFPRHGKCLAQIDRVQRCFQFCAAGKLAQGADNRVNAVDQPFRFA